MTQVVVGTDKEILSQHQSLMLRTPTKGRPKINRELAMSLLREGYSTQYITKHLECESRTLRRIKKEMMDAGDLPHVNISELEKEGLDFDGQCIRAIGISYFEWLKSRNTSYRYLFQFSKKVWEMLGKPSLTALRDINNPLGDQLCMKFLQIFGEDKKRIRRRKKQIRNVFRFLGRSDLCDRYLTMNKSRDSLNIREVPEITFSDFPQKLENAINEVQEKLGFEASIAIKFKIISQMRTGEGRKERPEKELLSIKVGSDSDSYIIINGEEIRCRVKAKGNEIWDITWFGGIKEEIKQIYMKKEIGERLFKIDIKELRKVFGDSTEKYIGKRLRLHDLRKASITWLYVMGVPLEIGSSLNVGWRDLNTPRDYYLQYRRALKKSEKLAYREKIPQWFKEGLEEYTED